MISIEEPRIQPDRFASYVEELQEFARSYELRVGSPEDLRGLERALEGSGPFRDECAAMLRSVVYRERGKAPPEELLAMLASAWGGPRVYEAVSLLQEPLTRLSVFAAGVMRTRREEPSASVNELVPSEIQTTEPSRDVDYALRPPKSIFAAASETDLDRRKGSRFADEAQTKAREAPVENQIEVAGDLKSVIKALEVESPDVQLYLQLLKQHEEKQEVEVLPTQSVEPVVLDERPVALVYHDLPTPVQRDDPWDANSELQRELRRFAAERKAKATAYRAAKAARPLHIKLLFAVEDLLFQLVGSNNFVRRYLSGRLALPGPRS